MHAIGRGPSAHLEYPAGYHGCDVFDPAALGAVLERIRQQDGPIRGILHGAGVESAAQFERKDLETVRATIASKAYGAASLMELTRQDPLEVFLAFGSVSGRFGGHGQTDYSLASDLLAKLVQRFRFERPECAAIAFHVLALPRRFDLLRWFRRPAAGEQCRVHLRCHGREGALVRFDFVLFGADGAGIVARGGGA